MTRWLAVSATLISIGAIGFVLPLGASGRGGTPPFEAAVAVLGIATPLASFLLAWHLWRRGHRGPALLSSTPLLLMVGGAALALRGSVLPVWVLLWLDLYVLLVFVVVLGRFGRDILRSPRTDAAEMTSH